ncbi:tetratricopeptide repeat protein, partial [Desulfonatronospira sp. MSAO_Bac3]|uniref:tetratricopeptide repeat protein n=1 Tax=Desulfonatronospira sp. MSAO_Bac3 TaxID=2293857 RepID=UPI000FEF3AEA
AYLQKGRLEDAQKLFEKASGHENLKVQALPGLARVEMKRGNPDKAVYFLEKAAALDEYNPEVFTLLAQARGKPLQEHVEKVLKEKTNPAVLTHLAQALAGQGEFELAAEVYDSALAHDPGSFEAGAGLAEVYGSKGRYSASLEILDMMLEEFPESYKLLLTRARVLAWSRQYAESLEAYDQLYTKNQDNHVVIREAARTAYWGKKADTGDRYYQLISTPAVDEMLLQRLQDLDTSQRQILEQAIAGLEREVSAGSVYAGFEGFFDWFGRHGRDLGRESRREMDELRRSLGYRYVIQKQAELERQSKKLLWNERFAPARRHLQKLVEHEPGNQEARFDLAQACCVLGLGDEEEKAYQELLAIDPLHGQASRALERRKKRSRPGFSGNYSFWSERGRGELARMDRHRLDMGLDVPLRSRHSFRVTGHRYFESPQKHAGTVQASGVSLTGEMVTGPHFTLAGGLTYKSYANDLQTRGSKMERESIDLDDLFLGHLDMMFNLDDYARLTLGYEKRETVANAIALAQGVYTENWEAGLDIYPLRRLELGLSAGYLDYSDDNHGVVYGVSAGYSFTDHPRRFRTILSGEYRDTSRTYQGCSNGQGCNIQADFKHPYWTPEDHWGSSVTFEFTHDLARDFFCGARDHFYQLELSLGTEKDKNHSVEVRGTWSREFENGLGINTQAMWHNSREWDAASLDLGLFYRF